MPKNKIHPKWYNNAKVFCDGQLILKIGATASNLNVATWSRLHPAYDTGSNKILDTEGQIEKFIVKYGWSLICDTKYMNDSTFS